MPILIEKNRKFPTISRKFATISRKFPIIRIRNPLPPQTLKAAEKRTKKVLKTYL